LHGRSADERAEFVARVRSRLAARRDRRGTRRAAELLALATGRPSCPAESALLLVIADAGLPLPACGYEFGGRRLAFAWPDRRVAVSFDDTGVPGWRVLRAGDAVLREPTPFTSELRDLLHEMRIAA
jgi:hypothetical protein